MTLRTGNLKSKRQLGLCGELALDEVRTCHKTDYRMNEFHISCIINRPRKYIDNDSENTIHLATIRT
jgi:hypothetical protein